MNILCIDHTKLCKNKKKTKTFMLEFVTKNLRKMFRLLLSKTKWLVYFIYDLKVKNIY